jgi:hypothetical protein
VSNVALKPAVLGRRKSLSGFIEDGADVFADHVLEDFGRLGEEDQASPPHWILGLDDVVDRHPNPVRELSA